MLANTSEKPERRTRALQASMRESGFDAAVLSKGVDMYYYSGFYTRPQKRHLFLIVPAEGDPAFFIPEPYRNQVTSSSWVETVFQDEKMG